MSTGKWTTTEVAEYLGISVASVRRQLAPDRWDVAAVSRQPGRAGENEYDPDEVRAAKVRAPGRWPASQADLTPHDVT